MSIEKCVVNLQSISCWDSIIEETFNGESSKMDLTLDNFNDKGIFIKIYKDLIQGYAATLV
jgi:hypothetical protein